jgi:pyruvate carboxylase
MEDLVSSWEQASSEALASFGDGSVFVERYIEKPRHIEVQILGDGTGNVIHLWERDCSIQRRHQKVIEMAPAWSLPDDLRAELHEYATRLTSEAKYKNAGTVEFLVDQELRPYFIEVNPRIQVEHTVTEEVTGIDLVQAQFKIAGGATLEELGFKQEDITARGVAIQCRVTTEDAERDFSPDTGTLSLYRHSAGAGIRMDGVGYTGLTVTPYYDSMLVKYTARGADFDSAVRRMTRALQEIRIRGVKTNVPFLLNVLTHPEFQSGIVTTGFIDDHPELKKVKSSRWGFANNDQMDMKSVLLGEKLLRYLANLAVNGHPPELGADPTKITKDLRDTVLLSNPEVARIPKTPTPLSSPGNRHILTTEGPAAYAKFVRENKQIMITDTTWRDAHQSLLATRMRTVDLLRCADWTNRALGPHAFSTEMWGGATFDVAMRFLRECPWDRLSQLRQAAPDVPFQMLLRGANAVGYTNYPDNVVFRFCDMAKKEGIDIFRVFDSLNYEENLKLGVEAAGAAGGFVEAAIAYTGDVTKEEGKYTLDYYRNLARKMVDWGAHSLAIKDMAGLLTPPATRMLVSALREDHPDVPIHVHTHDTPGLGVASMIAAAEAGADVIDCAMDALSGLTSQPSLGAIVANFKGTEKDTMIDTDLLTPLNSYWESVRDLYLPFESGQLSGSSDVYKHEIPGGQYTNLLFQSKQLGLTGKWTEIKEKYAEANKLLGDIPKVTPSSKVVGDLAQFMVAQNLSPEDVTTQADKLAFPDSVIQYLRGEIGVPPGGFPEPLRSTVLASRDLEPIDGRPGASMPPYDFDAAKEQLIKIYGEDITDKDVLSHALYPSVFENWREYEEIYGDVSQLPTNLFLKPLSPGDEVELDRGFGKNFLVQLVAVDQEANHEGTKKVTFSVNGETWYDDITDKSAGGEGKVKEKAGAPGTVGAPMSGVIVGMKVEMGDKVAEGDPVAVLSAMKMETSILATSTGVIDRILVNVGDSVDGDDLLVVIKS